MTTEDGLLMSNATTDMGIPSTMSLVSTIKPLGSTIIYVLNNITNGSTIPNITILKPAPVCTPAGNIIFIILIWLEIY
jgi:hypothetical protein